MSAQSDYLAEFPEPAQLLSDITDDSEARAVGLRLAALELFQDVISEFNDRKEARHWSAAEAAAHARYRAAASEYRASLDPKFAEPCDRSSLLERVLSEFRCPTRVMRRVYEDYTYYHSSKREILERYLSTATLDRYFAAELAVQDARADERAARAAAKSSTEPRFFGARSPTLNTLGSMAWLSQLWLLPALLLLAWISSDREETKTVYSTVWGSFGSALVATDVPTGKIIRGDKDFAWAVFFFWTLAFLPGYLLVWRNDLSLIAAILSFVAIVALAGYVASKMAIPDSKAWLTLRRAWLCVLGLATVNMVAWWIYIAVRITQMS